MVLPAPGTVVFVKHVAPLAPVHIVAPRRILENRDEYQEALLYRLKLGPTAMLLWECCGNCWRKSCTLNLWRTGRWCTATEPRGGGGCLG